MFALLACLILGSAVLSVLTEKLMHAAFYLFLTLIGVAGLYLQLQYEFLAGAQLSVYAGGILILFLFAIVLVHHIGERSEKVSLRKKAMAGIASAAGILVVLATLFIYQDFGAQQAAVANAADTFAGGITMQQIGNVLLGTDKGGYLLPFEATGILLLACIIGAVVIASKEKEDRV